MDTRQIPAGIKIISIFFYLATIIFSITGVYALIAGFIAEPTEQLIVEYGRLLITIMGVVFIALSILYFFVSRGLRRGKNWARITAIIICGLEIISGVVFIILGKSDINSFGVLTMIIDLIIICYLSFSKCVKEAFS